MIDNSHLFVCPVELAAKRIAVIGVQFQRRELVWILGIGRQSVGIPLDVASFRDAAALHRECFGFYEIKCFPFSVVQEIDSVSTTSNTSASFKGGESHPFRICVPSSSWISFFISLPEGSRIMLFR